MMEGILITMRNGRETVPQFDVIHLEVSGRCQLDCPYCYSKSGTELAVGEWQALVEELAPLTRQFTLGGGEPLLYDGLGVIVETIHRLGLPVSLTTNGLLLGAKGDLVSALDAVSVSYHGDLEVLREGLALLERMGIQRMVNFIMLDQDKPRFGAILEACKTFEAALVLLAPKHTADYDKAWFLARALAAPGIKVGLDGLAVGCCTAGRKFFTVASDGRFMQCSFVRRPWAIGEPAEAFGCLKEVSDEVGIPAEGSV